MTSAPLDNVGLVEMSVNPKNIFVYAGSKGREYFNTAGERRQLAITHEKRQKLELLNHELGKLLQKPEYEIFTLIGSGLQFKFGQTTIAYQDIYDSIPAEESRAFFSIVEKLVRKIDPNQDYFRIEATGTDMEIILTIAGENRNVKDFDKGDGLKFLDQQLRLSMEKGPNLICGDTKSDLPMVKVSGECTENTWALFVTQDPKLQKQVRDVAPHSFFVSQPDILVTLLNSLGRLV